MLARLGTWLALLLACQACKFRAKADESSALGKPTPAHAVLRRAGAFDLASTESGALLVVAEQAQLQLTRLDHSGKAQQPETLYRRAGSSAPEEFEIAEVAAATLGTRLGVVWLEREGASAHTFGLSGSLAKLKEAQRISIADVDLPLATPRGNLALGSEDGHFVAFSRGKSTACADQTQRDCVGYSFFRFDGESPQRSGPPLAVPAPCAHDALSFALSGARWYYGVCSADGGSPQTTVFTIQNQPSYYARADRVLAGCLPLGALATGDDLLVAADCAGIRRAVRVRGADRAPEEVRLDRAEAVCQGGKPLIVQQGLAGLNLPLDGRQDRLEAFLPERFSLPRARSVWTGRTLFVAGVVDSKLTIKGYRCDSTLLREVVVF
jgi:hypothetical protein